MHPPDRESKLLAALHEETWHGEALGALPLRAARLARRRHWMRRALPLAGAAAACLGLALFVRSSPKPASFALSTTAAASGNSVRENSNPGYEIISDAELLAKVTDRSFLVIDQGNGHREVQLLAASGANDALPR